MIKRPPIELKGGYIDILWVRPADISSRLYWQSVQSSFCIRVIIQMCNKKIWIAIKLYFLPTSFIYEKNADVYEFKMSSITFKYLYIIKLDDILILWHVVELKQNFNIFYCRYIIIAITSTNSIVSVLLLLNITKMQNEVSYRSHGTPMLCDRHTKCSLDRSKKGIELLPGCLLPRVGDIRHGRP